MATRHGSFTILKDPESIYKFTCTNKQPPMNTKESVSLVPVDFDPFAQTELEAGVPVTEPQMEILTACLIGGEDANRSYNESNSLQLRGPLNLPALQNALQELVN